MFNLVDGLDAKSQALAVELLDEVIDVIDTETKARAIEFITEEKTAIENQLATHRFELVLTVDSEVLHTFNYTAKNDLNAKDIARNTAMVFSDFASRMKSMKWTKTDQGFVRDYGNGAKMELIKG